MLRGQPVFPEGEFAGPRWLVVLRVVGLRHKVDGPTVLALARSVEGLGKALGSQAAEEQGGGEGQQAVASGEAVVSCLAAQKVLLQVRAHRRG